MQGSIWWSIVGLIKGDTGSLDYNPQNPLYNPSFHFIFHFLVHLVLQYQRGILGPHLGPCSRSFGFAASGLGSVEVLYTLSLSRVASARQTASYELYSRLLEGAI